MSISMKEGPMTTEMRCLLGASLGFLSGVVMGLGLGVLVAPQSGSRTRRHLRTMVEDMSEQAGEWVEDAKVALEDLIDRGKKLVAKER
ncbi:MAG: YtxH domain-containing protein [Nitrospirae bacterium]|nr:MAG: YtxH domain-containing protein [Nitrospirota bacterium]